MIDSFIQKERKIQKQNLIDLLRIVDELHDLTIHVNISADNFKRDVIFGNSAPFYTKQLEIIIEKIEKFTDLFAEIYTSKESQFLINRHVLFIHGTLSKVKKTRIKKIKDELKSLMKNDNLRGLKNSITNILLEIISVECRHDD